MAASDGNLRAWGPAESLPARIFGVGIRESTLCRIRMGEKRPVDLPLVHYRHNAVSSGSPVE
jgi:hypothetical protein